MAKAKKPTKKEIERIEALKAEPLKLGNHLLGRIPSPEDDRDWKLSRFLGEPADVGKQIEYTAKLTTVGFKNKYWEVPPPGTHWAEVMALLAQLQPAPAPSPTPTGDIEWTTGDPILDQGNYGTCVGNGFAQFGNIAPVDDHYDETAARAIYFEATKLDGDPDDPDAPGGGQQGATVRSGAKVMQGMGRIKSYAFADTTDEMIAWLRAKGSIVVGTDWREDMFYPDANGRVYPTGSIAGGHCYLCVGLNANEFIFRNSWGINWGISGGFRMLVDDFRKLLEANGEAVVALELPL